MLVPLDLRVTSEGRVRVLLVSGSASDDEDVEGAVEESVVMEGIVVGLASDETGSESGSEVVMAVV